MFHSFHNAVLEQLALQLAILRVLGYFQIFRFAITFSNLGCFLFLELLRWFSSLGFRL